MDPLTQVDDSADPPEYADDAVKEPSKHSIVESAHETALDPVPEIPAKPLFSRKLLVILAAIVIILMLSLVVCELTAFLYLQSLTALDSKNKNEEKEETYSEFDLNAANAMIVMMDHTVEPCDNFYSYACGGWVSRTSALNSKLAMSIRDEEWQKGVKKYLEVIQKTAQNTDPLYKQQPRNLFAACNNKEHRKKLGIAPFLKLANPLGRFIVTGNYSAREEHDFQIILTKTAKLGVHPFFVVSLDTSLREPRLKISKPVMLHDWSKSTYSSWVFRVMDRLAPRWRGRYLVDYTLFYSNLFERTWDDASEKYIYSIQELQDSIPWLNWLQFFRDVTAGTGAVNLTGSSGDTVDVELGLIPMLRRVFEFDDDVRGFYVLTTLLPFTAGLYPDFPKYGSAENLMSFPAFSYLNDCYRETFRYFPDQVNRLYFDEVLNLTLTPLVQELITDIKTSLRSGISENTWLSEESKAKLGKVLDLIKEHNFPELLLNDTYLNNMYKTIETIDYFEFFLERARFFFNESMKLTRKPQPVDLETRDRYSLSGIDMHMGLLTPNKKRSIIFGTTGSLKAMIMSLYILVFMEYENNSNLEAHKQCVSHFFPKSLPDVSKYKPPLHVNLTMRESIALQKSYEAYQNFRKRHGEERPLPDLGLNNDQLFFLSFTQMFCEWIPPGTPPDSKIASGKSRVLATLMNSAEFAETFQCKKGSPMNPGVKCKIF